MSGSSGDGSMKYTISSTAVVASFHTSPNYVIVGLDNGSIHIFSKSENKFGKVLQQDRAVWALDVCNETNRLLAGGRDGEFNIWDLATGTKLRSLKGHSATVRGVKILSPTRAISASRDCTLRLWNLSTGECEKVLEGHTKTVRELAVHGSRAVSISYDNDARVWDVNDGRCLHVLKGHEAQLYGLAFDGKRIATGSLDATARVWDVESGESLAVLRGHKQLVGLLVLVRDKLVSAGVDGTVRIWSMDDYSELRCIQAHDTAVIALECDGIRILTGGSLLSGGSVRIWDFETGGLIRELVSGVDAVWRGGFIDDKVAAAYCKDGKALMEVWNLVD